MANYCGKCGTGLDKETGLCPKCDREKLQAMRESRRQKLKKPRKNKLKVGNRKKLLCLAVILLFFGLITGIAWKIFLDIKEDALEKALQNSIQVKEIEASMDSAHEGSAIIEIRMPNFKDLFWEAVSASDPDQYLLKALKSGNYEIQTVEETARITVVDGKRQIHSEEVVSRVLETNLIEAINAVTEVLGHEENH